jgi:hypothetical protein
MELVFIPSGGVRGVPGVVSIISGRSEDLPLVILDSDQSGNDAKKKLISGLYQTSSDKLLEICSYRNIDNCEVEDLIPVSLMRRYLDRLFRDVEDEDIMDTLSNSSAVIPQIESFAAKHNVTLHKGWKVDMSKNVKQQLAKAQPENIPKEFSDQWISLFSRFNN